MKPKYNKKEADQGLSEHLPPEKPLFRNVNIGHDMAERELRSDEESRPRDTSLWEKMMKKIEESSSNNPDN